MIAASKNDAKMGMPTIKPKNSLGITNTAAQRKGFLTRYQSLIAKISQRIEKMMAIIILLFEFHSVMSYQIKFLCHYRHFTYWGVGCQGVLDASAFAEATADKRCSMSLRGPIHRAVTISKWLHNQKNQEFNGYFVENHAGVV
jgi:hypothetical protein